MIYQFREKYRSIFGSFFVYFANMRFNSKVSPLLVMIVAVAFFAPVINTSFNGSQINTEQLPFGLLVVIYGFVMYMIFNTHYTIQDNVLHVQSGFIKFRKIDILSITSVEPSRNLLSSPAPSFDRIKVRYGKLNMVLLSPKDKKGFTEALAAINPEIESSILG
ncbi:MAG: hypothetical protein CMN34_02295 [Saprospirales bacterium]|nr:hypothetical protein [Saprospirales bacterium]